MPDQRERLREHVLIVGVSTRALAASAARAGYRVTAVDAFGDLDLRAVADVLASGTAAGRFNPVAAVESARSVSASLVAYTSSFENHPDAVDSLAIGRRLLGNPPAVLRPVRNPIRLTRCLRAGGFAVPETRASAPAARRLAGRWLVKPRRSGGGHGTSPWRTGAAVSRRWYLQERIPGPTGSIVFLADGRRALPLGLSRQMVGEPAFGAHGFRYCGSLLAGTGQPVFERQNELLSAAGALAHAVTAQFGLVGLNGIDFIARDGVPYPIEVNPRYSASMELVERATGLSLFELHRAACQGALPAELPPAGAAGGKAIVFARRNVLVGDALRWRIGGDVADVPHPGERIMAGHPICTIFARGDPDVCAQRLRAGAERIYRTIESRARGAA
jgi:predicted ATP-grasp superfamily ATP-dependent carboligase